MALELWRGEGPLEPREPDPSLFVGNCPRCGTPWDRKNTYIPPRGPSKRACRNCKRLSRQSIAHGRPTPFQLRAMREITDAPERQAAPPPPPTVAAPRPRRRQQPAPTPATTFDHARCSPGSPAMCDECAAIWADVMREMR